MSRNRFQQPDEQVLDDDFPILDGLGEPLSTNYFVSKSEATGERVYRSSRCGDDTCWNNYYDSKGNLLEETPEIGPGTPRQYEIKTKVTDCKRTTQDYFISKVSE